MSFHKAVITVGGLTFGSRILGFLRDVLTASILGAGPVADAFFVALKLPNFFRRVTGEGAFSAAFVPLFAGAAQEDRAAAMAFAEKAQAVMLAIMTPFTILMILAMPWVVHVVAPGFAETAERYTLAVEMSRVTFPYILLMSLTALLGGVMNSFGRFGPFAAAPMLFNLSLIGALYFLTPWTETAGHALSWGVAMAGVLQLLWLIYSCRRVGLILKLRRPSFPPEIKKLLKNMLPGVFGAGLAQVNLFIDMIIASLLPVGAISYLYYADRLYQLPLGIVGTAIGTALLPMLSRALKDADGRDAKRLFTAGIEFSFVLALPAAAVYMVAAQPIMEVLFMRGAFSAADSRAASLALMGYSIGLPAFILAKVFSTAFFAREDTATPVKFAVICAVANTVLALALSQHFGHVGIAAATGMTAWINVVLLAWGLWKRNILGIEKNSVKKLGLTFAATIVMTGFLMVLLEYILPHFMSGGLFYRFFGLGCVLGAAAMLYGVLLWKSRVIGPDLLKQLFPKRKKTDTIRGESNTAEERGQ